MRLVKWYDEDGYLRQVYARDGDPDGFAKKTGVRHEPPDLSEIDWGAVERDLHNLLVERGLITWIDVQRNPDSLMSAVRSVIKRPLIALYRSKE